MYHGKQCNFSEIFQLQSWSAGVLKPLPVSTRPRNHATVGPHIFRTPTRLTTRLSPPIISAVVADFLHRRINPYLSSKTSRVLSHLIFLFLLNILSRTPPSHMHLPHSTMSHLSSFLSFLLFTALVRALPSVPATLRTPSFLTYDSAPGTPDAVAVALYTTPSRTLVLGTVKNGGLAVWDNNGNILQFLAPPYRPIVTVLDPPTPAGLNAVDMPCATSTDGQRKIYSIFNAVSIVRKVRLGNSFRDLAVVTDQGCDQLRFYAIDPTEDLPLSDVTAAAAPRVFPVRVRKPSPFDPAGKRGVFSNPVEEQNTAYGVTAWTDTNTTSGPDGGHFLFVTQRHRSTVLQVRVIVNNGLVSFQYVRVFLFDMAYTLQPENAPAYGWTPCRETPRDADPHAEGLVVLHDGRLLVGFEFVGLFMVRPAEYTAGDTVVNVGLTRIRLRVRDFGRAYLAIPDGDKYKCIYGPTVEQRASASEDALFVNGTEAFSGGEIVSDLEGVAKVGQKFVLVSSQGDGTFHAYHQTNLSYFAGFVVDGVNGTDGLDVAIGDVGRGFEEGLLVIHNGIAEIPDEAPRLVNGYALTAASEFVYVSLMDMFSSLRGEAMV